MFLIITIMLSVSGLSLTMPYILPRYFLFIQPLFFVFGAFAMTKHIKSNILFNIISFLIIFLFFTSSYSFSGNAHEYLFGEDGAVYFSENFNGYGRSITEKNMEYTDLVMLYSDVGKYVSYNFSDAIIFTQYLFPSRPYLNYPQMGYVSYSYPVYSKSDAKELLEKGEIYNVSYGGDFSAYNGYPFGVWGGGERKHLNNLKLGEHVFLYVEEEFEGDFWPPQKFEKIVDGDYKLGKLTPLKTFRQGRLTIRLYLMEEI